MARILIVDDNETMREGLAATVRRMGHEATVAASGADGLAQFRRRGADFVITDLKMEGTGGIEVVKGVREQDPTCPVMVVTAFGTVETAVEVMRLGAFDFLQKPFAPEVVRLKVERALELGKERHARERAEAESAALRADAAAPYGFAEIVGETPAIRAVFQVIEKVGPTDASVYIHGESGTGKELVARAIHNRSRRAEGPFVKVNCGALTETLLESELFGHEKGSFTGAIKRKLGRFELADKGTLFLDEIGDVTPGLQLKLLRVLQEREFERVGGEETIRVDVRVISATHRDIKAEVAAGRFREDLFYRLHVVPCPVPPLRERKEDIPRLVAHFIDKLGKRTNPGVTGIDDAALARLCLYNWPGNVRELENVIEQALVFAEGSKINVASLPGQLRGGSVEGTLAVPSGEMTLPEILEDLERQLIQKAYDKSGGVKTETARLLGIKTSALYYKLEKYGIGVIESRSDRHAAGAAEAADALLDDGPATGGSGARGGDDDDPTV
ncbi:MAG TPA: sigma-54 dependent transcriptional regulator [Polyangia bacterium]|jgi:two-component system response regulator HydG|nr:sigma-54 dependent transcriptional regulator [Polyangia bacterium]